MGVSGLLFAFGVDGSLIPAFVVSAFLQFVYTEVWLLDAAVVSMIWTVYNISKLLAMLVLGRWVDQTSFSKIFVGFIASLLMTIGFAGLWIDLPLEKNIQVYVFTAFLVMFGLGESLYLLARSNLFQELFDSQERSQLMIPQQCFFIVGIVIGMISPPILSGEWENLNIMNVFITGCIIVTTSSCLIGATMRPSKQKVDSNRTETTQQVTKSFTQNLLYTISHERNFTLFLIAMFCTNLAFNCMMASMQLYIKYMIPGVHHPLTLPFIDIVLDSKTQIGLAQLIGQLTSIAVSPLWLASVHTRGKSPVWKSGCILFFIVYMLQYFFQTGEFYFMLLSQVNNNS